MNRVATGVKEAPDDFFGSSTYDSVLVPSRRMEVDYVGLLVGQYFRAASLDKVRQVF